MCTVKYFRTSLASLLSNNAAAQSTHLNILASARNFVCVNPGLAAIVSGALPPRGQALPNADRMEEIIRHGLFPDKPRDMSFLEYFGNFTDLNENLTKALERLEFGVLDSENLEIAVKLAEDAKRFKDLVGTAPLSARRQQHMFTYRNYSWTWTMARRQKLFQFLEHSVYSTRFEINKLHNLRRRYNKSSLFKMGIMYGNNLEKQTTAGAIFVTMQRMPPNITMLWYVFHYEKLLNIAYDVVSNTEYIYLLNEGLKAGFEHLAGLTGTAAGYSLPMDSNEMTSINPFDTYRRNNPRWLG